ncbi:MAG: hypothetical protein K2I98_02025 [Prevotella sp.]|nr:hypothetical protein [Prevotella sp.]
MKLNISCFVFLFLCVLTVNAQELSTDDAMKTINQIKLDTCYVYADCTSTRSAEDAYKNAEALLYLEIQNWLESQKQTGVTGAIVPTNDECLRIQTTRGKMFRAFVYVDKNKIIPYRKTEKTMVVERETVEPVLGKTEKTGKRKKEKAEQVVETQIEPIYMPTAFEQQMLQVKKAGEIEAFVKSDAIEKFGKYKDRPQTGVYYLLVYNPAGEVPACLKFDEGSITNVSTGNVDTFDNYKGCGAYWFIVK